MWWPFFNIEEIPMYTHTETNIDDEQVFWDDVVLEILNASGRHGAIDLDTPSKVQALADKFVELRRESAQKRRG